MFGYEDFGRDVRVRRLSNPPILFGWVFKQRGKEEFREFKTLQVVRKIPTPLNRE